VRFASAVGGGAGRLAGGQKALRKENCLSAQMTLVVGATPVIYRQNGNGRISGASFFPFSVLGFR